MTRLAIGAIVFCLFTASADADFSSCMRDAASRSQTNAIFYRLEQLCRKEHCSSGEYIAIPLPEENFTEEEQAVGPDGYLGKKMSEWLTAVSERCENWPSDIKESCETHELKFVYEDESCPWL